MNETATTTRFVVVPRTGEHGGYQNKCFTHFVQDNGGRYCLRGPMAQSDAEWGLSLAPLSSSCVDDRQ